MQPNDINAGNEIMPSSSSSLGYGETNWTIVSIARGEGTESEVMAALNTLALRYRPCILRFFGSHGIHSNDLEDLCQDYWYKSFSKILTTADRSRGRFRTLLYHSLRAFIASHWRSVYAQKNANGKLESLEERFPEGDWGDKIAGEGGLSELNFEVDFALCQHRDVLGRLRKQYVSRGEEAVFAALEPHLLETAPGVYDSLVETLAINHATVRKRLSRLRERYVAGMFELMRDERWSESDDAKLELKQTLKLVVVGLNQGSRAVSPA